MLDVTIPGGAVMNPESKLAGTSRGRRRLLLKLHHRLLWECETLCNARRDTGGSSVTQIFHHCHRQSGRIGPPRRIFIFL